MIENEEILQWLATEEKREKIRASFITAGRTVADRRERELQMNREREERKRELKDLVQHHKLALSSVEV